MEFRVKKSWKSKSCVDSKNATIKKQLCHGHTSNITCNLKVSFSSFSCVFILHPARKLYLHAPHFVSNLSNPTIHQRDVDIYLN